MNLNSQTNSGLSHTSRTPELRQLLVLGKLSWALRSVGGQLEGRAERIIPAASLAEGQQYLREQDVDAVLLQADTPQCAQWVEAICAEFDLPVIAIGETDSVDAALVAGATDFIVEPFSRQVLIRRLDLVLETAIVPLASEHLEIAEPLKCGSATTMAPAIRTKTAHWELNAANGELIWSPSIARVLDPDTASHCCSLSGLLSQVGDEDRQQLQHELQQLADGDQVEVLQQLHVNGVGGQSYRLELKGEALADEFIFGTLSVASTETQPFAADENIDAQTGLPNQVQFIDRLTIMMNRLVTGVTSVLAIDLAGLPRIGGHFGHDVTVSLRLAAVARLRELLPPESAVALLSDGRIGVALENVVSTNVVHKLAMQLVRRLAENYYYDEQPLHVQPAIGIAVSSSDANEAAELLCCALTALEQGEDGCSVQFYADQNRARRQNNRLEISIEAYLYNALDNGELELHYQPQVDTRKREIIGLEALLRWTNPQLGNVAPMLFIPIAEKTGLIGPIGDWVMYEAARQMAEWRAMGLGSVRVSVNLSPKQLLNDSVEHQLQYINRHFDISPDNFDLEVTETVAIDETHQLSDRLARMRELGATVSLDDFGTRHSALSHLQDLEVDCLKIDRSFIEKIGDEKSAGLTDAIVTMAQMLEKKVIAEGVETVEQLRYLQQRGCDQIQGFYFCEPVNADTATHLLREGYEGLLKREAFSAPEDSSDAPQAG